jgi:hypothetical protein
MTAINFPDSPSNGDTHVVGGVTYTYDSTETKWKTTINSNAFLPLTGGTVSGNIVLGGEIQHDGDTDTNISFDTDTIKFDTAGSERFRVDSSGRLLVGTPIVIANKSYLNGAINPQFEIDGTNIPTATLAITNWSGAAASPSHVVLSKSKSGTVGTRTLVANNDDIGAVVFTADDGTAFIPAASILAEVDGTPGTNDMPGRLVFATTSDGASTPTERMRITSTGDLRFNSGYGSVATAYGCRAWVNFNGVGTVAIRASGNVSSITDNGTGDYTVNFTTAMPDANYCVTGTCSGADNPSSPVAILNTKLTSGLTTTGCRVFSTNNSSAAANREFMAVAIFR